jgi:biopolymer transport protein ExbD
MMALTFASTGSAIAPQPMAEMNTTPLIDVMLVLLIMFIITIPVATQSVDFTVNGEPTEAPIFDLKNKIIIDASGVTKFGFVGNEKYRKFGK